MKLGRVRRILLAAVTAVAVLAGCGGDDGGAADPPQDPQAQQLATSGLLVLDDFPAGWMATPAEDDDAPDHDCYDADVMPPLGSADSESFSSDSEATASNSVGVYGAEEDAAAALAIIRDPDVQDCLRDMITGQIKKGALTDGVKVRDLSFGALSVPAFGDDRAALRLEVTVESGPFTPTLYLDVVFVQVGRALAIYEFADVLWPFDEELGTDLVETTVERLRASVS